MYLIENQRVAAASIPWIFDDVTPLRTSNLRAPGELARCFASECTMDEIAAALHMDAVQCVCGISRMIRGSRKFCRQPQSRPRGRNVRPRCRLQALRKSPGEGLRS